ncbi:hypothetical protein FQA39_LY09365 [Lamprigera yunnana]|nr:hypothetical protein FQA39_LY09365 [Lamprigera yunnana]
MLNKLEETNQKLKVTNQKLEEKMLNKLVETNQKLDKTRAEIRTEMGTKLINVEAKRNQHKEERIQVCKDLKEHSKEIVDDVQEKTKIVNKMIMNYKDREYRNFQELQKGFMKNYWGIKEESVMKSELYGTKCKHSLKQVEEELLNKFRIIEVKKFDEVMRILEIHYQCRMDGVRNDGNKYYNHYNNYEQRKYNYSGQGRNNHNYSQGPYQRNQFYHYHKNRNSRLCGRNLNINKIIQQPRNVNDT